MARRGVWPGETALRFRMKIWIEHQERVLFGDGRLQLLKAVQRTGSLAGAARELGMSYRAAWGRIKASEDRLGFTLVQRADGGRRAMNLTPQAEELLAGFERLRTEAESCLERIGGQWLAELESFVASGQAQNQETAP